MGEKYKISCQSQKHQEELKMSGMIKPVEWKETYVKVLDQTLLPEEVKFMEIRDAQVMWDAIKMLCVRGAPAIGVAAGYGVAIEMQKHVKESTAEYHKKLTYGSKLVLGIG